MIVLMVLVGVLTGCASVFQRLDDRMHRKRFRSDDEAFEVALALYGQGNFADAGERFKALAAASTSDKISRMAWLGEICCHLMLAETQAEYDAAIDQWRAFGTSSPGGGAMWDLTLFDPLVSRMAPTQITRVIKIQPAATQISTETKVSAEPKRQPEDRKRQPADRQLQAEVVKLKKKLEQAAEWQRKAEQIEAENRSLKEKIKALEAIDQNIQKKKTEIAAPGE
jgi:hypothetical protein